jgi:hypothetical protein
MRLWIVQGTAAYAALVRIYPILMLEMVTLTTNLWTISGMLGRGEV